MTPFGLLLCSSTISQSGVVLWASARSDAITANLPLHPKKESYSMEGGLVFKVTQLGSFGLASFQ
jgi:hypothetical protein